MGWFPWLCFLSLSFLSPLHSSSPSPVARTPSLCHPHESSALLRFKNSFAIYNDSTYLSDCAYDFGISNPNSTMSWDMSRDCCTWSGVTCDEVTGHVIRLELGCSGIYGIVDSNSSLFLLTRLQTLILSNNFLYGSEISPEFGMFQSMIHLDLSYSDLSGRVPLELSYLSSLVTLDLGGNNDLRLETFCLKRIVANLTSLKELSLSQVNMSYVSPNSLMNLSISLTSLDLSESGIKGKFPENILHLTNLQELKLAHNENLTGSFPKYNWTSPLRHLSLSSTGFLIDLPYITRNLKQLNHLDVNNCNLKGSFPVFPSNITRITFLDLSSNDLNGQIPWDILNMERLSFLDLSDNNFEGHLLEVCSNSTKKFLCDSSKHQLVGPIPLNLRTLYLHGNLLNGTLPSWLYSLPSLRDLQLDGNQFTGHIGEFHYNSLASLGLSSNKLQGLIPRSIFHQVNLYQLDLSSNNLSGVAQLDQFSELRNLRSLSLSFNSLSMDSINSIVSVLPNTLGKLHLSSCNITGFPYSLRILENLEVLDLSNNKIEGSVPRWLRNVGKDSLVLLNISHNLLTHIGEIPWKSLSYIDLSSNRLQGYLPILSPSTSVFLISNNQLVGEISSLFCNLSGINVIDLSNNSLSGNIPSCLFGNLINGLSVLNLRLNRFNGVIPQALAKGNSLRTLSLNGNQLEGPLPRSLRNCENLEVLDVGNNKLNGSFPFWLESLSMLQVLILRSNRFFGPLSNPKVKFPFQKLRIIDISNNEFTGFLPAKYFENFVGMMDSHADGLEYMSKPYYFLNGYYQDSVTVSIKGFIIELVKIQKLFITIDFSSNNFTGEIPKVIGKLKSLKGLNFSHNKLSGLITPSLGNLSNLEWLDLSSNELSGNIPFQLAVDLLELEILNLSYNKLEGPIPRGRQFDTFNNDSYSGNLGLCGFPLSKSCGNDESRQDQDDDDNDHDHDEDHKSGMIDWKVVMMGYGSGMVIGISVGYMVLFSPSFDYWFLERFGGRPCPNISAHLRRRRRSN